MLQYFTDGLKTECKESKNKNKNKTKQKNKNPNISAFSMDKNEVEPHLQFDIFLQFVFFKAVNIFTQYG